MLLKSSVRDKFRWDVPGPVEDAARNSVDFFVDAKVWKWVAGNVEKDTIQDGIENIVFTEINKVLP